MIGTVVFVMVFLPMVLEAALSARHEALLRAGGAQEPAGDVFRAMQLAYPAAFLVMIGEAVLRQPAFDRVVVTGLAIFLTAKVLKYWTIAMLGSRWTFRVLVPPGSTRVLAGPYRFARHPNYVAVTGELIGVALMTHSIITGPLATIAFVLLIRRRIEVEERALGLRGVESQR
jgi:methyltransferase